MVKGARHLKSWHLLIIMLMVCDANVSADVVFRDDFTGKTVSPEWELVGEDPDRTTLDGENFLFLTTTDWRGLCYKGKLPLNYYIEAKIVAPFQRDTIIQLILTGDKDNYVYIERRINQFGEGYVVFTKSQKGRFSKYSSGIADSSEILLVLKKQGSEYSGYFGDGKTQVGREQIFFNFVPSKICIRAVNEESSVPEIPVRFDYFEIGQ